MTGVAVAGAVVALVVAVAVGLVAHELTHALVLRLAGVEYALEFVPGRTDGGVLGSLSSGPLAVVRPDPTGRESPWTLRLAALVPMTLAIPVFVLGATGHLPAPSPDNLVATAATTGWLACAIPSPQDFSVAWYADRLLDDRDAGAAASRV